MSLEHDVRQAIGQAGLDAMDVMDAELLELIADATKAITKVAALLKDRGTPSPLTFGLLVGLAAGTMSIDHKPG